ncbi:hypothetical protein [Streptomyces hydrogenans]|uniref:hypothetical protein n=1 Tax=Streptomyces hydrogenans TaxID=1873719 RepID=UPI0036E96E71
MTVQVNMAQIAREAGVGRAAVVNWRRRYDDFPQPVGGTPESPLFRADEATAWLHAYDKVAFEFEPPPPSAFLTLVGGHVVELHLPHLTVRDHGYEHPYAELGGYVTLDHNLPWPRVTITRAVVDGHAPFAVDDASIDISYTGSPTHKFVLLNWSEGRRRLAEI